MIAVIFEVVLKTEGLDEYFDIAAELKNTLGSIDGFISVERYQSLNNNGKFLSLSFWQDEESIKVWKNQTAHRQAQQYGREHLFEHYQLYVANVVRCYDMKGRSS